MDSKQSLYYPCSQGITPQEACAKLQNNSHSHICTSCTYLATTDIQSILEILATDGSHTEDRNHKVLPGRIMAFTSPKTFNRFVRKQLHLNHVAPEQLAFKVIPLK